MADERAQAISVANLYFSLADGMVAGFKDHLAEHIVLKWFGQVIRGKENVAAFILSNKKKSFHTFSDIRPLSGISCTSSDRTEMSTTHENVKDCDQKNNANYVFVDGAVCNEYKFNIEKCVGKQRTSADCDNVDENFNVNPNKFSTNTIAEMDHQSHNLNKNDLYNLFEPEITSQPIVGKIQNINRIKLKEEMAPTVRAINRECGQGDGPVTAEANATKYLEANGEIKFVQITNTERIDSLFLYQCSTFLRKKFWKRQCRLQIAYSLLIDKDSPKVVTNAQKNTHSARVSNLTAKVCHSTDKIQKSKLPSLEEAIQASNTLIRDVNHFGGYLQPLNFLKDRENFLKSFAKYKSEQSQDKITQKNPDVHSCVHYVNNKLIFDFPNKKSFTVIYQIHKIVYTDIKKTNKQTTTDAEKIKLS